MNREDSGWVQTARKRNGPGTGTYIRSTELLHFMMRVQRDRVIVFAGFEQRPTHQGWPWYVIFDGIDARGQAERWVESAIDAQHTLSSALPKKRASHQ